MREVEGRVGAQSPRICPLRYAVCLLYAGEHTSQRAVRSSILQYPAVSYSILQHPALSYYVAVVARRLSSIARYHVTHAAQNAEQKWGWIQHNAECPYAWTGQNGVLLPSAECAERGGGGGGLDPKGRQPDIPR